ncbi:uncharacterized protein MYCFIDRAFT_78948 [Pseudocercospora fijiensis CIRAD86]|uniref:Wings apart-like protein C-terminal domain-containing protein n=1 Tax=Pseudocercospora fijiensis (strain CIRAD86) TaxID=383855 RepID=M2YV35_PSEFD|nr:uncharacterized protein MYCFIDRAFT_78948 [Pseudocercospora fijiensis CIRAD86]EME81590.1 hypothetical protein MYCFIDRAFT_78948 [Pseudocercospora fijiensis CIRAD86]
MAAVSTFAQQGRRKQTTYGRASRNANAWDVSGFDASDDDDGQAAPQVVVPRASKTVKGAYTVQKQESKEHKLKPVKARAKKQDDFDVPSSDDEVGNSITRRSPPTLGSKRRLVDAGEHKEEELAPWERRATETTGTTDGSQRAHTSTCDAPGEQLITELAQATPKKSANPKDKVSTSSPPKDVGSPGGSSAAARLKARRLQTGSQTQPSAEDVPNKQISRIHKRFEHDGAESDPTPRKRPRSGELQASVDGEDVAMEDLPPPRCESMTPGPEVVASPPPPPKPASGDIFDFPESSADDVNRVPPKMVKRTSPQQHTRRGKLKMTSRSSPRKMESAPARLHGMLPRSDTDTTDSTAKSPSMSTSRPSTPNKSGRNRNMLTPETAVKTRDTATSKQGDLWDQVMDEEESAPSPSGLPMQELTLKSTKRPIANPSTIRATLSKSSSDVGPARRRTKLVDRLKASAPSSENGYSDDDESTDEDSTDVEVSSEGASPDKSTLSQSQMYSQTSATADSGPKITYAARVRSYLPEDSFEEGLMLGLQTEDSQPGPVLNRRTNSKSAAESQKSAFDLDNSDDDDTGGRMRTIHELRAGGGNRRFEDETTSLLYDIADHNASGRSRRRSALIELANKLNDKTFVEKFFRHGFEGRLLKECGGASDTIADVLLASILNLLLASDAPDHLAQSARDGGCLQWLVQIASNRSDLNVVAKDRSNNMSKSAQSTFNDFVGQMARQERIWDDAKPNTITIRILALKALEKVVMKLRRSGDRTDLIRSEHVRSIAPSADDVASIDGPTKLMEVLLSVSVLESLYGNAATLSWPSDVTERVVSILLMPAKDQAAVQTLHILCLRLCTYLTTDNSRNCKAFSRSELICHLLGAMLNSFRLHTTEVVKEQREKNLAFLVPAVGVTINLTLHNEKARSYAATAEAAPLLSDLVVEFQVGQKHMLDAESEEDGVANVAYGYLAVTLANLCRNKSAKQVIASKLPGNKLSTLVTAVEEFIAHHQKVDMLNDEAGAEVWGAFTEMLKGILEKLKLEA